MTDLDVPTMSDLFELYRELSQSLHEEARMACAHEQPGKANADIALRLENQAIELDRLIAGYESNRRSTSNRLVV